ncbi:MAG: hypothetical protein ACRDFB_01330 [Rhabdochlamydiaceae bacterium]
MENLQIIALVAIAISLVSITFVVANVLNLQTTLMNLNTHVFEQSQASKSTSQQANATQQLIDEQRKDILQMGDITGNLTNEIKSLEKRVASLEQNSQCHLPEGCPPPVSQQSSSTKFVPVALQDDRGNLWTSWFIKESLYYPTLYSTSCDALSVDCYVHFTNISTPNGTGIEADTIGSSVYGYWFLGYSQEYVVPENGTVTISGNFYKNDTFSQVYGHVMPPHPHPGMYENYATAQPTPSAQSNFTIPEGRSHIFVFILDRDPNIILGQKEAVISSDNATVWYHRSVTFNLTPGQVFRVGIGAENDWAADYHVYVAWNKVTIHAVPAWSPVQ